MKTINWRRGVLVTSLGAGLAWFAAGDSWTRAQETPPPAAGPRDDARNVETRSGKVEKLVYNDHNDMDGLRLEGGVEIHFPPHQGAAIARLIKVGDTVEVRGSNHTRPRGEVVFEALRITSRGEAIEIDRPRPPRPPRHPEDRREQEEPMNAKGTVKDFATNRHGDVDGLLLADGTEVKLPPHQGDELQKLLHKGDEVQIEGRRHETPHGDVHLHADRITAVASGKSIERDGPRGRPVPPHERHGHGPGAHHAPPHSEQFDEILKELREMRRLLEAQQKTP